MKLAGPVVLSSAVDLELDAAGPQLTLELAQSVYVSRGWAFPSQPGLKVRMLRSNMPWKSPIATSPFLRMSQPCAASPKNGVNPSFS